MAYVIAEPCVDNMDPSCVAVCPVVFAQVDATWYVDPDRARAAIDGYYPVARV